MLIYFAQITNIMLSHEDIAMLFWHHQIVSKEHKYNRKLTMFVKIYL